MNPKTQIMSITAEQTSLVASGQFGREVNLQLVRINELRYGENPHQSGALYALKDEDGSTYWPVQELQANKEMGYCNWWDVSGAWSALQDFPTNMPTVAIIKHAGPCGVAYGNTLLEAYREARACDATSAMGGIVAFNQEVTVTVAQEIYNKNHFLEVVIAPAYEEEALALLKTKEDMRILLYTPKLPTMFSLKSIFDGSGFLMQTLDMGTSDMQQKGWRCVTKRQPNQSEMQDLLLAWRVVKPVASNAIVFVKNEHVLGIGAGQANRARSVAFAGDQAGESAKGAVMASDAFFPKPDGLLEAIKFGITAVIQPGGSKQDEAVIEAANAADIAMIFTDHRHFRH